MLKLEPEADIKFRSKLQLCIDLIDRELQQDPMVKVDTRLKDLVSQSVDLLERCKLLLDH